MHSVPLYLSHLFIKLKKKFVLRSQLSNSYTETCWGFIEMDNHLMDNFNIELMEEKSLAKKLFHEI